MAKRASLKSFATALIAGLLAMFGAAPAFANEGTTEHGSGHGTVDPQAAFSAVGEPVNVVAILITGVVLLVVVLAIALSVSKAFAK